MTAPKLHANLKGGSVGYGCVPRLKATAFCYVTFANKQVTDRETRRRESEKEKRERGGEEEEEEV